MKNVAARMLITIVFILIASLQLCSAVAFAEEWVDETEGPEEPGPDGPDEPGGPGEPGINEENIYAAILMINEIGIVAYDETSKEKIDAARAAYNGLNAEEQALVTNYQMLTAAEARYEELKNSADQAEADQEAANAVIAKINTIGEAAYTAASKEKIDAARAAYNSLSDAQRVLVTNYGTLAAAEARYEELKNSADQAEADQEAANAVIAKINAAVAAADTVIDKAMIAEARAAYNSLGEAQRALVTNYGILVLAEAYIELKAESEKAAADQAAAIRVSIKIIEIGTVEYTNDSKERIGIARQEYDALSEPQKALVVNYGTLTAAEGRYTELKSAAEQAASETAVIPEPAPEPTTEAAAELPAEPATEATPEPATETTPEPATETTPEPATEATAELTTEPVPEPAAEQTPVPAPAAELDPASAQTLPPASATVPVPAAEGAPAAAAVQEPVAIPVRPAFVKTTVIKNRVIVFWKKIRSSAKTKKQIRKIRRMEVQYAADPKFSQNVVTKRVGRNRTRMLLKLQNRKTYYIRARYVGRDGVSKWSRVRKVKTK